MPRWSRLAFFPRVIRLYLPWSLDECASEVMDVTPMSTVIVHRSARPERLIGNSDVEGAALTGRNFSR